MSLHYKTSLIYFEIFAHKWITVLTVSGWKKTLTIRKILDAKQPLYLHICHVMMKGLGNGGESYKKQYRLRQIKSWLLKPDTTRIDLYSFALPSSRKNKKSTQIIKRLKRGTCKSCLKQNLFEKKACFGLAWTITKNFTFKSGLVFFRRGLSEKDLENSCSCSLFSA